MRASVFIIGFVIGLLGLAWARSLPAQAPAPVLQEVAPPGGQEGATVRVTLIGKDLEQVNALWFDHPGIKAALHEGGPEPPPAQPQPPPGQNEKRRRGRESRPGAPSPRSWDVTIDPGVPPGLYDLRVVNDQGVSAPRAFHVSPLPVLTDRDPVEGQPVAVEPGSRLFGYVEPGLVERFRLKAREKARIVVECYAERIDSRLDATLEVRDLAGRRVAFSSNRISLDPALAFDAQEGGEYQIDLWDFTYGGKYPYLLAISSAPRPLFAFPPALSASGPTRVTFYGWNLPGGQPVPDAGEPLEALTVEMPAAPLEPPHLAAYQKTSALLGEAVEARLPGVAGEPLIFARGAGPAVLEREPNGTPAEATPLTPPCEASGRFGAPGDRDWYSLRATKGQTFEIEVESARLGAPCDPVLLIAKLEAGAGGAVEPRDVLFLDERKSEFPKEEAFQRKFVAAERDPETVWKAPQDGDYLLQLRNRNGRSGPPAIYRLCVRAPAPDFSLVVIHSENRSGEAITVPRGGSQSYDVLVERRGGFNGVVKVSAEGLPEGVICPPVYLGPGESFVPLVFSAAPEAGSWTGRVQVVGTSPGDAGGSQEGRPIRRLAASAVMVYGGSENRHPLEYVHSRVASSLLLAVRDAAPFQVRLEPELRTVPPGGKISLRARVVRQPGFSEGIQLSYQGLNEKAFPEQNGNRPAKVTLGKDKSEETVSLTLKGDVPYGERTFVVYATAAVEYPQNPQDSKSKKEKRRTTFVSNPVTVRLAPPLSLEVSPSASPAPPGALCRVGFRVSRLEGVDGEVEVTLDLPKGQKGLSAEAVKLPRGAGAGEVLVKVDPGAPPARVEGAVLRAAVQFAGKRFEEKRPLPFALERAAVSVPAPGEERFLVREVEAARLGALRFVVRRGPRSPEGELRLSVLCSSPSGGESRSEVVLGKDQDRRAVLLEGLPGERPGQAAFPLRVLIASPGSASPGSGAEVYEEHIVQAVSTAIRQDMRRRSF